MLSLLHGISSAILDWKYAGYKDRDIFLSMLKKRVQTMSIGCTFLPEKVENWGDAKYSLSILQFIVEDMGIKDIRLGLRWNKIELQQGKRSLAYYAPFLNYLAKKKCRVTLNIGPIKSCGWPEIHVPDWYVQKYGLPKRGEIQSENELGIIALSYTEWLLQEFRSHSIYEYVVVMQPENESYNPFGELEWTLSDGYLTALATLVRKYWSGPLLLNSSGLFDAKKILRLWSTWPKDNLVLGIDYYYTLDKLYNKKWTRVFDHFTLKPTYFGSRHYKQLKEDWDINIEVSEAQFEPWGRTVHPGQNLRELHWILLRSLRFFDRENHALIRLWGVEQLADRMLKGMQWKDDEQQVDLIRAVNDKKNPA